MVPIRAVPIIGSAKISATDMEILPISVSVQNSTRTDITIDIYTVGLAIICTLMGYTLVLYVICAAV